MAKPNKQEQRVATKEQVKKEVAADMAKDKESKYTAPPAPLVSIAGVENPLIASRGLKRAMVTVIAQMCKRKDGSIDEPKAAAIVRASGILHKAGYKKDDPTEELCRSEWSGRPYVRWVYREAGKVYADNYPEKIEKCKPFVAKLVEVVSAKETAEK